MNPIPGPAPFLHRDSGRPDDAPHHPVASGARRREAGRTRPDRHRATRRDDGPWRRAVRDAIAAAIDHAAARLCRSLTRDQRAAMARDADPGVDHGPPLLSCDPRSPRSAEPQSKSPAGRGRATWGEREGRRPPAPARPHWRRSCRPRSRRAGRHGCCPQGTASQNPGSENAQAPDEPRDEARNADVATTVRDALHSTTAVAPLPGPALAGRPSRRSSAVLLSCLHQYRDVRSPRPRSHPVALIGPHPSR